MPSYAIQREPGYEPGGFAWFPSVLPPEPALPVEWAPAVVLRDIYANQFAKPGVEQSIRILSVSFHPRLPTTMYTSSMTVDLRRGGTTVERLGPPAWLTSGNAFFAFRGGYPARLGEVDNFLLRDNVAVNPEGRSGIRMRARGRLSLDTLLSSRSEVPIRARGTLSLDTLLRARLRLGAGWGEPLPRGAPVVMRPQRLELYSVPVGRLTIDATQLSARLELRAGLRGALFEELVPRPEEWHHQAVVVTGPGDPPAWTRRLWTGPVPILIGGRTYQPTGGPDGSLMGISGGDSVAGGAGSRTRVHIFVWPTSVLRDLSQDIGPARVDIHWIMSPDYGLSWRVLRTFRGRLSDPVLDRTTGEYSFDLETYSGDRDRQRPLYWSDEQQEARHPGDRGMEHLSELAAGKRIDWPR